MSVLGSISRIWDSTFGIMTRLRRSDDPRFDSPIRPDQLWGPMSPTQWVVMCFPGVWLQLELRLRISRATPQPQHSFMVWTGRIHFFTSDTLRDAAYVSQVRNVFRNIRMHLKFSFALPRHHNYSQLQDLRAWSRRPTNKSCKAL